MDPSKRVQSIVNWLPVKSLCGQGLKCLQTILGQHIQAIHGDLLLSFQTEEMSALDQILDLSAIQANSGQHVQVFVFYDKFITSGAVNEVLPDLSTSLCRQIRIRQEQINARLECMIQAGDAVRSQEADPLVVFKLGEKDYDLLDI